MEPILIAADDFHYEEKKKKKVSMVKDHDSDYDSDRSESEQQSYEESESESDSEAESSESDSESDSDSEMAESKPTDDGGQFGVFNRIGLALSSGLDLENTVKGFNLGMGSAAGVTEVVAVHKQLFPKEFPRKARIMTFRRFSEVVGARLGGEANIIKYGCYFGSKDEIVKIFVHGFSSLNADECGRIQLVPLRYVLDGAREAKVGEDGMRHMLMCRVLVGKVEELPSGSEQVKASSSEFDIGVDCVVSPRRYFVWSNCMNSHIMPVTAVSFKGPASLEGYVTSNGPLKAGFFVAKRSGPGVITFPGLVVALTRFLTPREMKIMVKLLGDFRAKRFDFEELRRKANLVAGDKLDSALKLAATTAVKGSSTLRHLPTVNRTVRDIQIPILITVLAEFLPANKIEMLSKSLGDFQEKKIDKPELARNVRLIVGNDKVLFQAINSYRARKQQELQDEQPMV